MTRLVLMDETRPKRHVRTASFSDPVKTNGSKSKPPPSGADSHSQSPLEFRPVPQGPSSIDAPIAGSVLKTGVDEDSCEKITA